MLRAGFEAPTTLADPARVGPGLSADSLQAQAEQILNKELQMPVRFNADEALSELSRLHLLVHEDVAVSTWIRELTPEDGSLRVRSVDQNADNMVASISPSLRPSDASNASNADAGEMNTGRSERPRFMLVSAKDAQHSVSTHWNSLLDRSAAAILNSIL